MKKDIYTSIYMYIYHTNRCCLMAFRVESYHCFLVLMALGQLYINKYVIYKCKKTCIHIHICTYIYICTHI